MAIEAAADKSNAIETPWIVVALLTCPVATAILLVLGGNAWEPLVSLSSAMTVGIFDTVGGLRTSPAYVAEAISLFLAACLAALAPAAAIGASESRLSDKARSAAALFPVWLIVVLAPTLVIFQFSGRLDPSLHRAHLSADFILLFAASATSIALAYSIWVWRNRNAFMPRRVLRKLPEGQLATGSGRYMGIGVVA